MGFVGFKTNIFTAGTVTSTQTGSSTTVSPMSPSARHIVFRQLATYSSGSPTLDGKIQHSPTGAADTWVDLATFTQVTGATALKEVHVPLATVGVFPCVRYVGTYGGTGGYSALVVDAYTD